MATRHDSSHQGGVKDPENDGRLKENREEGRTKSTTPGSAARAREHGHEPAGGSHSRAGDHSRGAEHSRVHETSDARHDGGGESRESHSESADLKQREYRDEKGEIHHHTRTYMEQHGKVHGSSERKG